MTPTEQDNELRESVRKIANHFELSVYENQKNGRNSIRAGIKLTDSILDLITADRKRVALEAAIMGAKFGNAAIRQHNIANPTEPINLDVVRDSGIQQAKAWAEQQC